MYIQLANGTSVKAGLRDYAMTGRPLIPDGTVAFVITKLCRVSGNLGEDNAKFHLEAISIEPHPVASKLIVMPDKKSKSFQLLAADWVHDEVRTSTIHGHFDGSNARWTSKDPPNPAKSSVVQIVGPLSAVREDGNLEVTIEHISLALGPGAPATPSASTSTSNSPTKKRKYGAAAQGSSLRTLSSALATTNSPPPAPTTSSNEATAETPSEQEEPPAPSKPGGNIDVNVSDPFFPTLLLLCHMFD
ncbi:hypothetical protein FRC01_014247 [Tulasnella sp. 417]|nr:hypothetical protein FRC01_014247 [Tulasnella sp. 417]